MAARTDNPVILVVEDDPSVRELLADVLDEVDYEVVAVPDGNAALRTMQVLHVDLITLDLDLPGLSGSEFLRIVHERQDPVPPVIVISSSAPLSRELQSRVQGTLSKPFDVDDLIAAIRKLAAPPDRKAKRRGAAHDDD